MHQGDGPRAMEPVFDIIQLLRQEDQPGFTPVRRRDQALHDDSPPLSMSAPWTTSRCNRLLRPLSSRIALLRRHREHKDLQSRSTQVEVSEKDLKPRRKVEDNSCHIPPIFQPQPSKQDDPEWTPDHEPRKRLKRTYSSRNGLQKRTQSEAGHGHAIPLRRTPFTLQVPVVDPQVSLSCGVPTPGQNSGVGARFRRSVSVTDQDGVPMEITRPRRAQIKPALTRESFRRLAKSISPDEWMLYSGIYTGLDALLKATAKYRPQPVPGARSLFASCLRKVPEYIAEEERWIEKEHDEDENTDISSTIYGELESLGAGESTGWKPLREIVRAHGIAMVGDAIKDGTIRPGIARGLAILCLQASAHVEADLLLDSWLCTIRRLAKPLRLTDDLFETSIYMRTLRDTTGLNDRWRFMHKSLTRLLTQGIVPVEWMSCRSMVTCWNQAARSITSQDESAAEAVTLVRTVVSLSYQDTITLNSSPVRMHRLSSRAGSLPLQAQKSMDAQTVSDDYTGNSTEPRTPEDAKIMADFTGTVSRVMAILLSINTMYAEEEGAPAAVRHSFMQELLLTLAIDAHQLETTTLGSANATRICLPLLSYVLMVQHDVKHIHDQLCITFLTTIGRVESQSTQIGTLASFLCAIAHCCEKNGQKAGFDYMQSMVQRLLQLSEHSACNRSSQRSISRLGTEAAFEFAEQASRQEHLDWALEVEETIELDSATASGQQQIRTPAQVTQKKGSGFRWEEGICEWVAKTPAPFAVMIPKLEQDSSESSSSSDEDDKTDVSTLPSELEDMSVLSQPTRRRRGRPSGKKRARGSTSQPNELDAKPVTRSRATTSNNAREDADEFCTVKASRGRPPHRRPHLADVTNCPNKAMERGESAGDFQKIKRLREHGAQLAERRIVGRKRRRSGLAVGDFSEDELGI